MNSIAKRLLALALPLVPFVCLAAEPMQAAQYQVVPKANPAISRQAMVAVRPTGEIALDDAAIDARLVAFASANAGNPAVQSALDRVAAAIKQDPSRYVDADGSANLPAVREKIGTEFEQAGQIVVPRVVADGATTYPNLGSMGDGDIMALCFIVMMEAAKSAQEDLKSIMAGVKAINQRKQAFRETSNRVNPLAVDCAVKPENCDSRTIKASADRQDIDNAKETIKNDLDSMSEMGEMESLRLQMAMDRLSKLMSTLSNLLKKVSDTESAIIQNMK